MDTQSTKTINKNTYNAIATAYESNYGIIQASTEFAYYIAQQISVRKEPRILDLGCGGGHILQIFENELPNAQLVGVDFSSELLKIAESKLKRARLVCEDYALFDDGTKYDVIVATFSLIHSTNSELEQLIPKMYTMLNDKGYLYTAFILGDGEKCEPEALNPAHKTYFNFHTKEYLINLFTENHFKVLKEKLIHSEDEYENEDDIYLILTK